MKKILLLFVIILSVLSVFPQKHHTDMKYRTDMKYHTHTEIWYDTHTDTLVIGVSQFNIYKKHNYGIDDNLPYNMIYIDKKHKEHANNRICWMNVYVNEISTNTAINTYRINNIESGKYKIHIYGVKMTPGMKEKHIHETKKIIIKN